MEKYNINYNKCKLNIWIILYYLIVYSFLGCIIETIFGIFNKGVIEARHSFLFAPFCLIYGIAGIIILLKVRKEENTIKIFLNSIIIGIVVEYLMSYFFELIYHFKWWDYSDLFFNINGRICLIYSICWGFLGLLLVKKINPFFTNIFYTIQKKNKEKALNCIMLVIITLLFVDMNISSISLKMFSKKIATDFNIDIGASKEYTLIENITSKLISTETLVKTYPNMQIVGINNKSLLVASLYKNIPNYYFILKRGVKTFTPTNI